MQHCLLTLKWRVELKIGEHASTARRKCWTAAGNSFEWRFAFENLKETFKHPCPTIRCNNIWLTDNLFLELKPWSARILYVCILQIVLLSELRKKIIFSCPANLTIFHPQSPIVYLQIWTNFKPYSEKH